MDFDEFYTIIHEKCGSFVEDDLTKSQLYAFYQEFGGPILNLNEYKARILSEFFYTGIMF